jgi:hypothetical protein
MQAAAGARIRTSGWATFGVSCGAFHRIANGNTEERMADEKEKILVKDAITLIFNDSSKNISDLKTRTWSATTLSVAGIIGVDTLSQKSNVPPRLLALLIISILIGHGAVMLRCQINFKTFKERLIATIQDRFPTETHALFPKGIATAVVDEGTILFISFVLVWGGFIFALWDICTRNPGGM